MLNAACVNFSSSVLLGTCCDMVYVLHVEGAYAAH